MRAAAVWVTGSLAVCLAGCETTSESIVGPAWGGDRENEGSRMFYPAGALADDVSGVVVVQCEVGPASRLVNCEILYETPTGYGFGAAALAMQRQINVPAEVAVGKKTVVTIPFCTDERSCAAAAADGQRARSQMFPSAQ